ncbi:hypothetical protein ELQ39_15850 [Streptomyces sp. GB4-14]|uniref:hypothetical protein n=1 Tax=Streptomyces sp. GB4-14 TaxID=2498703 RepID=UPI001F5F645A|nr:hypothetical protein [Streptomyces sp. GB4-14]
MSQPSPDARAVVAAVDRLTTQLSAQVRRLADTRQTPADGPSTTCDASTLGIGDRHLGPCVLRDGHDGPVHRGPEGETWASAVADTPTTTPGRPVAGIDPSTEPGKAVGHWFPMNEQLAEEMNERSSLIQQWAADAAMKARADDEEQQRTERRARLHNLLARADRGHLTPGEVAALRELVDAETREADTARAVAHGNLRHVQMLYADLQDAHRRAEQAKAERDRYARSEMEEQDRAEQAQAAIARVRALHVDDTALCRTCATPAPCNTIRALDGTEQPKES